VSFRVHVTFVGKNTSLGCGGISKHEARNTKQTAKRKIQMLKTRTTMVCAVLSIVFLNLAVCFEFRASDFEFGARIGKLHYQTTYKRDMHPILPK
jgi:hypothetical protein